ncbi:MAG: aconitase/3-isopropylmalate dehydratase large subunit family protein [Nitrospinota bacterium]
MGMTITEKILAAHAGRDGVRPGELVQVRVDQSYSDDLGGPLTFRLLEEYGVERVFDPERLFVCAMVNEPGKDIASANIISALRYACARYGVRFYEAGEAAIHNTLVIEQGLALPGELLVGGNSHACMAGGMGSFATGMGSTDIAAIFATGRTWLRVPPTLRFDFRGSPSPWVTGKDLILYTISQIGVGGATYKAMEFSGAAVDRLEPEERFALCNMAVEAGAKSGIVPPDAKTLDYARERARRPFEPLYSDRDADYERVYDFDVEGLPPLVAEPWKPENVKAVEELRHVRLDQVYIGSCANGWIQDLRVAARVLRGKKVAGGLRVVVIPSTAEIARQMAKEGLTEVFLEAGAAVSPPTCGPCIGAYMGVLGDGEVCLSTSNRNFRGRQGSPKAMTYLSNPAVAAASALTGRITPPEEVGATP